MEKCNGMKVGPVDLVMGGTGGKSICYNYRCDHHEDRMQPVCDKDECSYTDRMRKEQARLHKQMDTPAKILALRSGIYDCILDPYDKLENGDENSSVLCDLDRFAKMIVGECLRIVLEERGNPYRNLEDMCEYGIDACNQIEYKIKAHFGVEK